MFSGHDHCMSRLFVTPLPVILDSGVHILFVKSDGHVIVGGTTSSPVVVFCRVWILNHDTPYVKHAWKRD